MSKYSNYDPREDRETWTHVEVWSSGQWVVEDHGQDYEMSEGILKVGARFFLIRYLVDEKSAIRTEASHNHIEDFFTSTKKFLSVLEYTGLLLALVNKGYEV